MSKDDEVVMCISREKLVELFGEFSGFLPFVAPEDLYRKLLRDEHIHWIRRGDCENNPEYKQIIPYVVLVCDRFGDDAVFRYTRMKSSGEQRLAGLSSVGLGGHVNPTDGDPEHGPAAGVCFDRCLTRELEEEVLIDAEVSSHSAMGLINHDEDAVGKVHVGVAYLVRISSPSVYPREDSQGACYFEPVRSLKESMNVYRQLVLFGDVQAAPNGPSGFERWTEILLESEFFGPEPVWQSDVIVEVRGGVVQAAYARDATLNVAVLDWDDYEDLPSDDDVEVALKTANEDRDDACHDIITSGERRRELESLDDVARDFFDVIY